MLKKTIIAVSIGYITGILWGIYVKDIFLFICFNFLLILFFIFIYYKKYNKIFRLLRTKIKRSTLVWFIICILIGYTKINYEEYQYQNIYNEKEFVITVISDKDEGDYYDTYTGKIDKYNMKVYLLVSKELKLHYGDILRVKGKLEKPRGQRNSYGFNYMQYLKSIKVVGTIKLDKVQKMNHKNKNTLIDIIYNIRESIKKHIYSIVKTKNKYIIEALLIGNNENIDEEITENFRKSSLTHLLAISGTHIAIINIVFMNILSMARRGKKLTRVINILILFIYIFVAGGTPSIVRSCISFIIILISNLIHRKSDVYSNLSISSFIILFINPYSIFNLSFILSYFGVFGLLLYNEISKKYQMKVKYLGIIVDTCIISICIQIILMPILINNFQNISLIGFISNVLASPLVNAIITISIITIMLSYICMPLSIFLGYIIDFLVDILLIISKICAKLPLTEVICTRVDIVMLFTYYFLIVYIVYLVKIDRFHIIKHFFRKQYKKLLGIFLVITLWINILSFLGIKDLKVNFIDVGQGDSTLIRTPHNRVILIDGGGKEDNSRI